MKQLPPPPGRRVRRTPPPVAGLGPDSLARLTHEQISARVTAARARTAAASRRTTAHGLARAVAALPAPKPKRRPDSELRQRTVSARPTRARTPAPSLPAQQGFTSAETELLVRFANAYDAGKPVHVGLTPAEVAWAHAQGRRLRSQRQTF